MSGVNCARRNGSPSARAVAFASSVFATARHAFEQHVAADEERDEQPVDRLLLPEHDLGHLGLNAIAHGVHRSLLARRSSAAARVRSGRARAAFAAPRARRAPPRRRRAGRPSREPLTRSGATACGRAPRPREQHAQRLPTKSRRGGASSRVAASAGPSLRPRATMNASAATSMPPSVTSHSVRDRREAALGAEAVVALEEGDAARRRARRARARARRCPRTRASRSAAARCRRAGTPRPRRPARRSAGLPSSSPSSGSVAPASSQEPRTLPRAGGPARAPPAARATRTRCHGSRRVHTGAGSTRWCSQPNAGPAATSRPPRSTKRRSASASRLLDDARVGEYERRARPGRARARAGARADASTA